MKRMYLMIVIIHATYSMAHKPTDITGKLLDTHVEVSIHHPSDDPDHYISHVIIKRGSTTLIDQEFDAQTDCHSLDIQIIHPKVLRKRIRQGGSLSVTAICSTGKEVTKNIRVR